MKKDISLFIGKTFFNYRVGAVIQFQNKMLLHRNLCDDFWHLVGGRIKIGEDSKSAIIRELEEEIHLKLSDIKLFHIQENFYKYKEKTVHEILTIYKVVLEEESSLTNIEQFVGKDSEDAIYKWFDLTNITKENINLAPDHLYEILHKKNDQLTHLIEKTL